MSDAKSKPPSIGDRRCSGPRAALDALLGPAGDHAPATLTAPLDPLRRALWLDALDHRLHPLLPPALAAHARLANVDGGRIVFVVDSPVWHARLRLASDELLDAARSIGLQVDRVIVKIAQAMPRTGRGLAVKPMSAGTQQGLRDALALLRDPREGTGSDGS